MPGASVPLCLKSTDSGSAWRRFFAGNPVSQPLTENTAVRHFRALVRHGDCTAKWILPGSRRSDWNRHGQTSGLISLEVLTGVSAGLPKRQKRDYSQRSAVTGSTRVARYAGMQVARSAAVLNTITVDANTAGSRASTPNIRLPMKVSLRLLTG